MGAGIAVVWIRLFANTTLGKTSGSFNSVALRVPGLGTRHYSGGSLDKPLLSLLELSDLCPALVDLGHGCLRLILVGPNYQPKLVLTAGACQPLDQSRTCGWIFGSPMLPSSAWRIPLGLSLYSGSNRHYSVELRDPP